MKYLKKLASLMISKEKAQYNESFKERFREIGIKAMEELARILELKEYRVSFNPGGIAVSGDLTLMGMWTEGNGVYISMNKDFPGKPYGDVLYRQIKHMADYTGGPNNYFKFELLRNPKLLRGKILALRDNYHELVIESFHNCKVSCTCGRWTFSRTGKASLEEIQQMFKKHITSLPLNGKERLEVYV